MNYLLPAQTLLDLCAETENVTQQWSKDIPAVSLRISVISWAHAASEIASLTEADVRETVESVFAALVSRICRNTDPPELLEFQRRHAEQWRSLRSSRRLENVSQIDRQVYATALADGLTVVEERNANTDVLREMGLRIIVPGD